MAVARPSPVRSSRFLYHRTRLGEGYLAAGTREEIRPAKKKIRTDNRVPATGRLRLFRRRRQPLPLGGRAKCAVFHYSPITGPIRSIFVSEDAARPDATLCGGIFRIEPAVRELQPFPSLNHPQAPSPANAGSIHEGATSVGGKIWFRPILPAFRPAASAVSPRGPCVALSPRVAPPPASSDSLVQRHLSGCPA